MACAVLLSLSPTNLASCPLPSGGKKPFSVLLQTGSLPPVKAHVAVPHFHTLNAPPFPCPQTLGIHPRDLSLFHTGSRLAPQRATINARDNVIFFKTEAVRRHKQGSSSTGRTARRWPLHKARQCRDRFSGSLAHASYLMAAHQWVLQSKEALERH